MILSNREIHAALDSGRLIIEPEPTPRFPENGKDCPYQTTAVDLRLGSEIRIPKDKRPFSIDLTSGQFASLVTPENYDAETLEGEQPFELRPQTFILAKTLERVSLPIGKRAGTSLAARIEGRSSYARSGMLVHFTAPTIHAGFSGTITLEIINLGKASILLKAGARICQLIVEEVKGVPFRNDSQFQGQRTAGGRK